MFVDPHIPDISCNFFSVVLRPLKLQHNLKGIGLYFIHFRNWRDIRNISFLDTLNVFIMRLHYFIRKSMRTVYVLLTI